MKLSEALRLLRQDIADQTPLRRFGLACGFTPLHLETFLAAHLQQASPAAAVHIETGLFGDLASTIERLAERDLEACAIVIEWADLDERLGNRSAFLWQQQTDRDVIQSAKLRCQALIGAMDVLARHCPLALCLPTLPFPAYARFASCEVSPVQVALAGHLQELSSRAVEHAQVRLLQPDALAATGSIADRLHLESELAAGFPYTIQHTDALAAQLARLLQPPAPLKGIITDLDDTLWQALLGEVGPQGVQWDTEHDARLHGLYQQLLQSLALSGVMIGVASKNNPELVKQALARRDLLLDTGNLFPIETGWGAKSEAVARILQQWNIAADDVLLIDDSGWELAEVQAVHPQIHTRQFPARDLRSAVGWLSGVRDLFAKGQLTEEDRLRIASLRAGANAGALDRAESGQGNPAEQLLQHAEARICISITDAADDGRVLELVNKTNQFNLNGRRYSLAQWRQLRAEENATTLVIEYEDKYARLGAIAVLIASVNGTLARVPVWVMSCRAFSRRVEYATLSALLHHTGCREVQFDYRPTERNEPLRHCLEHFFGHELEAPLQISVEQIQARMPELHHEIEVMITE